MRVCAFMYPELFDDAVFLKGSHPDRDSERPAISYRSPRECYAYVNRAAAVVQIINDGNPNGCKIL